MKPRDVKRLLDERVVGQHEAKKAIAVAISEHYHHARRCLEEPALLEQHFHKPNMLLFGPSGSGKSHLMRAAASIAGAPFVKADATKFSATGYVGGDVADVPALLLEAADHDLSSAQFGLVYVDEIDKVCCGTPGSSEWSSGVNTRDVQTSLLKLMEDFEVQVPHTKTTLLPHQKKKTTFSTKFVLFVFAGAFEHKRLTSAQDFVDAGLLREFVGRIPVRVALKPLTVDDLLKILRTANDVSPLSRYVNAFANHGIRFTFDDDALALVAERAHAHGLGARGLLTQVEQTLRDFSYHLPSCHVDHFHLDRRTVLRPHRTLLKILQDHRFRAGLADDDDDDDLDASSSLLLDDDDDNPQDDDDDSHHRDDRHRRDEDRPAVAR